MSPVPPILAAALREMESLAAADPRFEADARLIAARRLRIAHQALTEAGIQAETHRHTGLADGFHQLGRAFRAAADRIEAGVPVREEA
jgi:hypothetical protein